MGHEGFLQVPLQVVTGLAGGPVLLLPGLCSTEGCWGGRPLRLFRRRLLIQEILWVMVTLKKA